MLKLDTNFSAMEFASRGNCTIPHGALWITRENDIGVSLKRCCHLSPFKVMPFEEFSKIDDVVEYTKNFDFDKKDICVSCTIREASICDLPKIKSFFDAKGIYVDIYYDVLDENCKKAFYAYQG